MVLFVGDDWAQDHHDVELMNPAGKRLARARLPEGVDGIARFHALVAEHLGEDAEAGEVVIGIETDRGPWVAALIAAGYAVFAVNPLQAARYRDRHTVSGAKSDPADAHVLADMVRTWTCACGTGNHIPSFGSSRRCTHLPRWTAVRSRYIVCARSRFRAPRRPESPAGAGLRQSCAPPDPHPQFRAGRRPPSAGVMEMPSSGDVPPRQGEIA